MRALTNLAARPFHNERLPWLVALILLSTAGVLTALQWRAGRELLSGSEARMVQQVRADEARIAELEAALAAEPPIRIEAAERKRLRDFRELVDRRLFPWRGLLAALEGALPPDVRLIRIAPSESKTTGRMTIELGGEARSKDAAFSFAEALGASPEFSGPVLRSLSAENAAVMFELDVDFRAPSTARGPAPTGSSSPSAPSAPLQVSGTTPGKERP